MIDQTLSGGVCHLWGLKKANELTCVGEILRAIKATITPCFINALLVFVMACCAGAEPDDAGDESVSMTLEEAMDKLESSGIEVGRRLVYSTTSARLPYVQHLMYSSVRGTVVQSMSSRNNNLLCFSGYSSFQPTTAYFGFDFST